MKQKLANLYDTMKEVQEQKAGTKSSNVSEAEKILIDGIQ